MLINVLKPLSDKDIESIARKMYLFEPKEYTIVEGTTGYSIDTPTERIFNTIMYVDILSTGLSATITLLPPINTDLSLSKENIINTLTNDRSIQKDLIDYEILDHLYEEYMHNTIIFKELIATAKPPINGVDVSIKLFFDMSISKPKILPNGKVDYKTLNNYVFAKEGDMLLKRTPPTMGTVGKTVLGADINPVPGRDKEITALEGVTVNDDQTEYSASTAGQIIFYNDKIFVSPLLEIRGNLDYKSGNIVFKGTVDISGDALAGFSIKADDIIIQGIYEDAVLEATNSVIIKTGIKGKSKKGSIKAGTDVISRYAENANITAYGNIEIEKYCLNSTLTASTIICNEKNSMTSGGSLTALKEIQLFNVGSKGSNDMSLQVGISLANVNKADQLHIEISKVTTSLNQMKDVLSKINLSDPAVVNNPKIKKILEAMAILKKRFPLLTDRYNDYKRLSYDKSATITVEGNIVAGVKIRISDSQLILTSDMSNVKFYYDKESKEISFMSL